MELGAEMLLEIHMEPLAHGCSDMWTHGGHCRVWRISVDFCSNIRDNEASPPVVSSGSSSDSPVHWKCPHGPVHVALACQVAGGVVSSKLYPGLSSLGI